MTIKTEVHSAQATTTLRSGKAEGSIRNQIMTGKMSHAKVVQILDGVAGGRPRYRAFLKCPHCEIQADLLRRLC